MNDSHEWMNFGIIGKLLESTIYSEQVLGLNPIHLIRKHICAWKYWFKHYNKAYNKSQKSTVFEILDSKCNNHIYACLLRKESLFSSGKLLSMKVLYSFFYFYGIGSFTTNGLTKNVQIWEICILPVEECTRGMNVYRLVINLCFVTFLWVLLGCVTKITTENGFLTAYNVFAARYHVQLVSETRNKTEWMMLWGIQ